jgi:hypothetical protein
MFCSYKANAKLASEIGRVNELKAGLHYGDYRCKLVHFEAQKHSLFKKALA